MIRKLGDLFDTDAVAIGHGVNCKGVMGAGIAAAFKEKFPRNYNLYRNACENKLLVPGETFVVKDEGLQIFNMATQNHPGPNAQYRYVHSAAYDAAEQAGLYGIDRVAIPMIGCGIGSLEWGRVEEILRATESLFPNFEFEVWKL